MQRPRIGIIGGGAVGTLFAWHLAPSNDVTVLDVQPFVVEEIARNGVQIEGGERRRVQATREERDIFGSQAVFLFVRATDTLRALRPFAGELNPSTPIVSLQNGLGNEDAIKTALGGNIALIVGATTESAFTLEPGVVRRMASGTTVVGSAGAAPQLTRRVVDILTASGLPAHIAYDIRPHLWGKAIANAAINPVAALLDRPNGIILTNPQAEELSRALAQEAATVANAIRIALPFSDPWSYVRAIVEATAELPNSMTYDLAHGKTTEIDYINGAIVATGRRAAVPTPYNDAVARIIRARQMLVPVQAHQAPNS
jgi:2-dehydropantoate 2-reductase